MYCEGVRCIVRRVWVFVVGLRAERCREFVTCVGTRIGDCIDGVLQWQYVKWVLLLPVIVPSCRDESVTGLCADEIDCDVV